MDKKISAIFFDIGNVLVKYDLQIMEDGFLKHCKQKKSVLTDYFQNSDNAKRYMIGKLNSSQFYAKTRKVLKIELKYYDFYDIWNSIFISFPEMEDIVMKIREKYPDIKMIAVSDMNEAHCEYLISNYKVVNQMDGYVWSHIVGKRKPNSIMYNNALKISGATSKEVFYIDDKENFMKKPRSMGIKSFHFTDYKNFLKQLENVGLFLI